MKFSDFKYRKREEKKKNRLEILIVKLFVKSFRGQYQISSCFEEKCIGNNI